MTSATTRLNEIESSARFVKAELGQALNAVLNKDYDELEAFIRRAALVADGMCEDLKRIQAGAAMSQPMALMVSQNTVEWYTPQWVTDLAREVLGGIDLDPASNPVANEWVQAETFYTKDEDGYSKPWRGTVWLNPPFDETERWARRLEAAYVDGDVTAGLFLCNSAPGYNWYERLVDVWPAIQFRKRMAFVRGDGLVNKDKGGLAKKSQTVIYFGRDIERFEAVFSPHGRRLHNPVAQPVGLFQQEAA